MIELSAQLIDELDAVGAIQVTMIETEAAGQDRADPEFAVDNPGALVDAGDPQGCDIGQIDDRRGSGEGGLLQAAGTRQGEGAALHLGQLQGAGSSPLGEIGDTFGNL